MIGSVADVTYGAVDEVKTADGEVAEEVAEAENPWWHGAEGAMILIAFLSVGISWFMLRSGWTFGESLYFCVVTLTTVGYGDIVPLDAASKIFVILYVIAAISTITTILSVVVEALIERQAKIIARILHE